MVCGINSASNAVRKCEIAGVLWYLINSASNAVGSVYSAINSTIKQCSQEV